MAVALAEKVRPVVELPPSRRFGTADLNTYGGWLLKRLTGALQLDERRVAGWLQGVMLSREYHFLCTPHAVALAQMSFGDALNSTPVIHVKFVFAASDKYIDEAATLYEDFRRWGASLGAKIMVLNEPTDVPDETVRKVLGRVFTKEQVFARI